MERGTRPFITRGRVLGCVVALCVVVVISERFYDHSTDALIEWLSTLLGTIIGASLTAGFGIWLFFFQSHREDEDKEIQLLTALAGETQSIFDTLNRPDSARPIWGPDGQVIDQVVTVPLPTLVAQEAMRSGVFYSSEVLLLSNIIGRIQIHNNVLFFILSAQVGVVHSETLQYLINELKWRQEDISESSALLLEHLESEGIQVPLTPES
jgi:hypothetical protein